MRVTLALWRRVTPPSFVRLHPPEGRQNPRPDTRWRWRGSTPHTLTCLGDERVQGLGLPEALAIAGSPVFQPIGLAGLRARGQSRAVVHGGPIPLCCLLGPLSLETHSRGGGVSIGGGWNNLAPNLQHSKCLKNYCRPDGEKEDVCAQTQPGGHRLTPPVARDQIWMSHY